MPVLLSSLNLRCFSVLLIILGAASHDVFAAEAAALRAQFSAEEVSDSIYVIHGPNVLPSVDNQGFMNNPGFIVSTAGVVVIDPGSSVQIGRIVLTDIAKVTDRPVVASIATYIHGDHWLGNHAIREQFPDAKLYAHVDLIEKAQAGEAQNWLDLMMQLADGATEGTVAVIPDQVLDGGGSLTFGDFTIGIHHQGQAHTDSDIALLVSPGNLLFAGDLVFNKRLGRMDDGTFSGLSETLEQLIALSPDIVVPGHDQTGGTEVLEKCLALYHGIYDVVSEKFEEGFSDYEIKPFVVKHLAAYSEWSGFEESIGRLVSLAYLEAEENNF